MQAIEVNLDPRAMFEKGASDAFDKAGISREKSVLAAKAMSKLARDSEDESMWDRNKGWAIPTIVGLGAFLLGDHFGKYGRRDRGAFRNAIDVLFRRVRDSSGNDYGDPIRAFSTKGLETTDQSAVGTYVF